MRYRQIGMIALTAFFTCLSTAAAADESIAPSSDAEGRATICGWLAETCFQGGHYKEAAAAFDAQRQILAQLSAADPGEPDYAAQLGFACHRLAESEFRLGSPLIAQQWFEQAIVYQQRALQEDPRNPRYRHYLAVHEAFLAAALFQFQEYTKSERLTSLDSHGPH